MLPGDQKKKKKKKKEKNDCILLNVAKRGYISVKDETIMNIYYNGDIKMYHMMQIIEHKIIWSFFLVLCMVNL